MLLRSEDTRRNNTKSTWATRLEERHSHFWESKLIKMKIAVVLASTLAVASAFAPAPVSTRSATELMAAKKTEPEKKPFFSTVFGMDLFAPNPDVNTYGARSKKNVSCVCYTSLCG